MPAGRVRAASLTGSSARRTSMPCDARLRASAVGARGILAGHQQVLAHGRLLAVGHGAAAILEVVAQQLLAVAGGRDRRGDGRVEVVHHPVAIGEGEAVAAREREAAGRGLLVRHADRALERRPRVAVARIERVVDLAHVVRPAALVEPGPVGLAEEVPRGDLALRDVRVDGLGGRREVVRVVAALLVEIDGHLRLVVEADRDAPAALGLRLREPVAVHVEEVVIGAAAGPRLVVLGAVGHGVRRGRLALQVLEDETRAPVRVLHRVDQHQRVAQHGVDAFVALRRQQVIRLHHRGLGRGDLVAVHAVGQPHDHGQFLHEAFRVGGGRGRGDPRGGACRPSPARAARCGRRCRSRTARAAGLPTCARTRRGACAWARPSEAPAGTPPPGQAA